MEAGAVTPPMAVIVKQGVAELLGKIEREDLKHLAGKGVRKFKI
jgi:hypothetical protein